MHGLAPRNILGTSWWNKTRDLAYRSTAYHCIACGIIKHQAKSRQHLEGHEIYDINYETGLVKYVRTVPLCHYCHNYIHDGRLVFLLDRGDIHHAKFRAIIVHGDRVLEEAGLHRKPYFQRCLEAEKQLTAPWSAWRLELFGELHKPLYDSYQDWERGIQNRQL